MRKSSLRIFLLTACFGGGLFFLSILEVSRPTSIMRYLPLPIVALSISLLLLLVTTTALLCVEKQASGPRGFEKLAFEAVSAFGTVGLSAGATPELTDSGKLLITMLMFIGRIGPLTMALLLIGDARPATYRYPETRIMVG